MVPNKPHVGLYVNLISQELLRDQTTTKTYFVHFLFKGFLNSVRKRFLYLGRLRCDIAQCTMNIYLFDYKWSDQLS